MRFDILTLFPAQLDDWFTHSVIGRARKEGLFELKLWDLRQWGLGRHQQVDDTPYGGGAGMVLKVDVVVPAIREISADTNTKPHIILLTPQGQRLTQAKAEELAGRPRVLLVAGHYEGFDERIRDYVDEELSLGDFVLTGGEIAAAAVVDSVARLLPDVLDHESPTEESHSLTDADGNRLLEYPHYTRPEEFEGKGIPNMLTSGHHQNIKDWRLQAAVDRTNKKRG